METIQILLTVNFFLFLNKVDHIKNIKIKENPLSVSTTKTLLEKILEEKPDLKLIKKDFIIKVLKKIIIVIEKISKSYKPGNYLYTQKLLNISNKPAIKSKFYDILQNDNIDLTNSDLNLLLLMIGEILNSANEINIRPDLLKFKEFNENLFDSEMNPESVEIFVNIFFKILKH